MPRIKPQIRKTVRERAAGRCEYCRSWEAYASQPFEVDHIIPSSRDGLTELENLAYACGGCNGHKHNKVEALNPAETEVFLCSIPGKTTGWIISPGMTTIL